MPQGLIAMNDLTPGTIQTMPGAQQAGADNPRQFITFTLDAQEYGVDIMRVREIKGWTETTALPQAPSYVRGVINLRGIIVPILDLRARFGMGTTIPTRMHVVIIVITDTRTTGLLVDAVSDIITVEPRHDPRRCRGWTICRPRTVSSTAWSRSTTGWSPWCRSTA